ncbi:four-carbon acid sugar kinase family protein [Sinomonas susongensis]|uniref:four-carbon acid sugar kinase family protein n=1 Tax=Sinomonas susongensis TaxID=1324851 RepID=UPI001FE9708D|nr:four-carbon acid sugar kinase family protein [Sinomonas susongensis]
MVSTVVIADDLTGAADSAVAFARRARTVVVTRPGAEWPEAEVVAVSTESRHLDPEQARALVRDATWKAARAGALVFKKIDSLLRGNVGAEVAGVLDVLAPRGPVLAVLAPAFPRTGRTTERGSVLLDGVPLPGRSSVSEAMAGVGLSCAVVQRADWTDEQSLIRRLRALLASGIQAAVADAATEEDLSAIAAATEALGREAFLVGTGGIAAHLAGRAEAGRAPLPDRPASPRRPPLAAVEPPPPAGSRPLMVVGSYSTTSRLQLEELIRIGFPHVQLPRLSAPLGPEERDAVGALHAALGEGGAVLTPHLGDPLDKSRAALVSRALASAVAAAVPYASALVVSGGETAAAVLEALGTPLFWPHTELLPGVVLAELPGQTLPFVIKSGSFGGTETLAEVAALLGWTHPSLSAPHPEKRSTRP